MITAIAPFNKSKIKVKIAANLFPVLRTFVAPIFPDPILRKFPSPIILDIIIPKGMEPIKYANKITKKYSSNLILMLVSSAMNLLS